MKLSYNSLHYKLYSYVFGKKKPTSLCSYFWLLLLSIPLSVVKFLLVILFLKFINYLQKLVDRGESENYIIFLVFQYGIFFTFIWMGLFGINDKNGVTYSLLFKLFLGFEIIGLSLLSLVYLIERVRKYIKNNQVDRYDEETPKKKFKFEFFKIAKEYLKSLKDKMCPLIEWE